jgi:hypothetical protein
MRKIPKFIIKESILTIFIPVLLLAIIGSILSFFYPTNPTRIKNNYDIFGQIGFGVAVFIFGVLLLNEKLKWFNPSRDKKKDKVYLPKNKFDNILLNVGYYWPVYNTASYFLFIYLYKNVSNPMVKSMILPGFIILSVLQTAFMIFRTFWLFKKQSGLS